MSIKQNSHGTSPICMYHTEKTYTSCKKCFFLPIAPYSLQLMFSIIAMPTAMQEIFHRGFLAARIFS